MLIIISLIWLLPPVFFLYPDPRPPPVFSSAANYIPYIIGATCSFLLLLLIILFIVYRKKRMGKYDFIPLSRSKRVSQQQSSAWVIPMDINEQDEWIHETINMPLTSVFVLMEKQQVSDV